MVYLNKCNILDNAKVWTSNLYIAALGPFCYLEKQTLKVHLYKFVQELYIFLFNKHKKTNFFPALQELWLILKGAAQDEKDFSNLAREQKSLATPAI